MAIDWRNEPVIDSVQLPGSETKCWVKDTEARQKIEDLVSATHFLGVTTTALTDESTTNPIVINGEDVTAVSGDITIYKQTDHVSLEFIFDGTYWQLLGGQAIEGAGALAYKDTASGSYIPSGSVTLSRVNEGKGDIDVVTDVTPGSLTVQMHTADSDGYDAVYVLTDIGASDTSAFVCGISTSAITAGFITDAGSLPTLTDITVSGLTAYISNTTLVLETDNADVSYSFNSGSFPTYSFASVRSIRDITYASALTSIGGKGSYIYGTIDGGLNVAYSGVTGTFAGSSATITVS